MSAPGAPLLATTNTPETAGRTTRRGLETLYLLLIVVVTGLAVTLLPGLVRSNDLPLPVLNNLENPIRVEGFYPTESNGRDVFRWTSDKAVIYLPETLNPVRVTLEVSVAYPEGATQPRLHLLYRGKEIANWQPDGRWIRFQAKFPAELNLATAPLELVVDNPLPPRQGDNRTPGVAVKLAELEVSPLAPPGLILTTLALGVVFLLAGRRIGLGRFRALLVSLGPVLLIALYWQTERFYGSLLIGWLALAAGLVTFVALEPRAFFPPVAQNSRWRQFNGGFLSWPFAKNSSLAFLNFVPPLLVAGLVFLVYGKALDYGFFWDDYHIARPWTWGEVAGTFAGTWDQLGLEPAYFRPLTVLSFALDWLLWGYEPAGYHLTNLLLFGLAAALLYFLLRKLKLNWFAALVGAGFFVILPPNVAAAQWISERSDSLAAVFMLGGLLAFDAFRQSSKVRWLVFADLFLALALCSKEIAVILPLLYAGWLLVTENRKQGKLIADWKKWLIGVGSAFLITGLYLGWRSVVLPASPPDPDKPATIEALWNGYNSAVYQSFYGFNNLMTEKAAPWFTLALLLLFAAGFIARPKSAIGKGFFFGLGWLLVSCGPLALLGASYSVTARVLFLPEAGYALIVAALVGLIIQFIGYSRGGWRFWPALILLAFLLLAPVNPLNNASQRAQKDYAPTSFNTLRWDEWIYNRPEWKAKIPEYHFKTIEQKLKDAGRIK